MNSSTSSRLSGCPFHPSGPAIEVDYLHSEVVTRVRRYQIKEFLLGYRQRLKVCLGKKYVDGIKKASI